MTTARMEQSRELFPYGIDAPGVVLGMVGTGLALVAAGSALVVVGSTFLALLGWIVLAAAIVPSALGVSMLLYAFVGKMRLRDHLLRQRQWRGDEVVLDIGAGRGLMAVGAALRAPRGRVIALDLWSAKDLSGNTPDALRRNAAAEGVLERVEILTGDARSLSLEDSSVDVVASVFCLHNIEPQAERDRACNEIARILKPGGTLLLADFPGVRGYVPVFRSAGLEIDGPYRSDHISFPISGYLVGRKT